MSGFEIAGIVLSVLPLIVEAVKEVPKTDVGKKSQAFVRAPQERRKFAGALLLVDTALRNAMLDIFKCVNIALTDSHRELLTTRGTTGTKFIQVWKDMLHTHTEVIQNALLGEEIRPVVDKLEKILIKMVEHTQISHDTGRPEIWGILQDRDQTLSITKHLKDRYNFAKSSPKRAALLKEMHENIQHLNLIAKIEKKKADLVAATSLLEARKFHGRFFEKVRGYSDNLHDALSAWNCMCHKSRKAMLRLEKRVGSGDWKPLDLRFSLILTFNHSGEDPDVRTFRESEVCVNSNGEIAYRATHLEVDMCQLLAAPSQPQNECLEFVLHEKSLLRDANSTDRKTPLKFDRCNVSLRDLLDRSSNSSLTQLSKQECLHLAVIISSSLLQLYATPWLHQSWCAESICFTGPINAQHPVNVKYPYIASEIDQSTRDQQPLPTFGLHPDLVALGIILLELSEKKLITEWWDEQRPATSFPDNVQGKAGAAWRWYEHVSEGMSLYYRHAFLRCLNVHYLDIVPPKRMTLADEAFREAVYRHVVLHLEKAHAECTTPIADSSLIGNQLFVS